MKVTKITIISSSGPDHLILHTNLPEGCFPYHGNATARIEVAADKGVQYIKDNFPDIDYELIKIEKFYKK